MADGEKSITSTYGIGTRLTAQPSEELLEQFQESLSTVDDAAFDASIEVSLAHIVMLAEEGVITRRDGALLVREVLAIAQLGRAGFLLDPRLGDLLPNMENLIISRLGPDVGGRFHTGRSRGDYYVAIARMKFRRRTLDLLDELLRFRQVLVDLARQHVSTLIPGYTVLQHAQPITLGHYLMASADEAERDFMRLREAYRRVNVSPMGLGIIATTSFPLNRQRVAALLGFDDIVRNGRDLSDRDFVVELAGGAAIVMVHLNKLAADLQEWATSEFAMVRVADADAMTSSMMPQKANPALLEAVQSRTGSVYGSLMATLAILKISTGNTSSTNACDRPGMEAVREAEGTLRMLAASLRRLTFNTGRMEELAGSYWSQATDLADLLVRESELSFRQAHRIVGSLVSLSYERGLRPIDVDAGMVDEAAIRVIGRRLQLQDDKLREALDPRQAVEHRQLIGGPAPEVVTAAIADSVERIGADHRDLADLELRLSSSRESLEQAAEELKAAAG